MKVSYAEVDNDDVRDLLSDCPGSVSGFSRGAVPAAKPGEETGVLSGLSEIDCDCVSDVLSCFASGQCVRTSDEPVATYGATTFSQHHFQARKLHGVFTINITLRSEAVVKRSTIRFVDLAPSDQVFGRGGGAGAATDLGLLSLNNVVSALGDPRRNVSCVPYEDSLLSR